MAKAKSPKEETLFWFRNFLAKSHPELGRTGHVCPYAEAFLEHDSIRWEIVSEPISIDEIHAIVHRVLQQRMLELKDPSRDPLQVDIILFETYSTIEDSRILDAVHHYQKLAFMDRGLMVGQFHPYNLYPGVHNKAFHPQKSPTFFIAVREMVRGDWVFLAQDLETRAKKLEAIADFERKTGHKLTGMKESIC